MKIKTLNKKQRIILFVSFIYWTATFFLERLVFEPGAAEGNLRNYLLVKIILLPLIYGLLNYFVSAFSGLRSKTAAGQSFIYMLPVFVIVAGFWAVSNAWPLGYGDQYNILLAAYSYDDMNGFFNYLTIYVYMLALNLIPIKGFAVVFKILLISMAVGYCIYRLRRIYPSNWVFLLYAPFLIPPGFYLSYNIHRAPMYAVLYLFFCCMVLCDHLEGVHLGKWKFVSLCLMTAVITQWRSEGIYLFVFGPVLLYLAYRPKLDKKSMCLALCAMMAAQVLIYVPQSITSSEKEDVSGGRAMPLFEYLITGMERKGLDKEKNAEDLAIVDKYLSVEAIHKLNEECGDYCYNDNLIIYHGKRHDATLQEIEDFKAAVIRIVVKNPLVYIRTQLGAWSYISTANVYERKLDYISNIFTDLYVPTIWMLGLWIYLLLKKKWCFWFMTSCHLCHMAITTALLPAAYFKYYYSEYLFAVFSAIVILLLYLKKREEKTKAQ